MLFLQGEDLRVASWTPGPEGTDIPPTQVHIIYRLDDIGATLVMRLKSRAVCNSLIDALIDHRDEVFGDAKDKGAARGDVDITGGSGFFTRGDPDGKGEGQ